MNSGWIFLFGSLWAAFGVMALWWQLRDDLEEIDNPYWGILLCSLWGPFIWLLNLISWISERDSFTDGRLREHGKQKKWIDKS